MTHFLSHRNVSLWAVHMKLLLRTPSILTARSMSRSSNISLSDPSSSRSSGSLLLSNPVHVAKSTTRVTRKLEASGSTYSDRPVLSEAAVPRGLCQQQEPFSQLRYNQQNHHLLFLRLAAILVCTTCRTHDPCSFLRPVRASLVLLHHVLRRSILGLPSRCTLAQCRLNPPLLVHRWRRRLDTKHILLPRGNLTLGLWCRLLLDLLGQVPLTIFPLRCHVMWELVTRTPLLRMKLVRLTMRW